MMWDDQRLRDALRAEVNGPAPDVTTELSDIVPRGRRHRRLRQAGTVAAAVGVVAGIGVVAMTLGGPSTRLNEPAQTHEIPTAPNQEGPYQEARWSRADLPAGYPITTWTPPPGAQSLPGVPDTGLPLCGSVMLPSSPDVVPAPMSDAMRSRLIQTLVSSAWTTDHDELKAKRDPTPAGLYEYAVDVTDNGGTGSILISSERSPAEPLTTANAEAFTESNCQPPKRLTRPDGTILQIYQLRPSFDSVTRTLQSVTQSMSLYLPDRSVYRISVRNWGRKDLDNAGIKTGPGRPSLPLTELQLSQLGEQLVG